MDPEEVNKRLTQIALEVKNGAKLKDYQLEIDQLLGTELTERSPEAEAVYENQRGLNDE
jgi:hypothetical protein